jgi:hypothetical protein
MDAELFPLKVEVFAVDTKSLVPSKLKFCELLMPGINNRNTTAIFFIKYEIKGNLLCIYQTRLSKSRVVIVFFEVVWAVIFKRISIITNIAPEYFILQIT